MNPAPHAALVQQMFLVGLPSAGPCASARPKGVTGTAGREPCGRLGRGGGLCVEEGSLQSGLPLGRSLSLRVSPSLTLLSPGREALADPEVWAHETDPSLGWTEVSGLVPTPARCDTGSAERPPQAGQQGRGGFRSPLDLLWLSILGPHSCRLGSLGNTAIWVRWGFSGGPGVGDCCSRTLWRHVGQGRAPPSPLADRTLRAAHVGGGAGRGSGWA